MRKKLQVPAQFPAFFCVEGLTLSTADWRVARVCPLRYSIQGSYAQNIENMAVGWDFRVFLDF
jgi:hypothetical protein